jgi:hypothetical protein
MRHRLDINSNRTSNANYSGTGILLRRTSTKEKPCLHTSTMPNHIRSIKSHMDLLGLHTHIRKQHRRLCRRPIIVRIKPYLNKHRRPLRARNPGTAIFCVPTKIRSHNTCTNHRCIRRTNQVPLPFDIHSLMVNLHLLTSSTLGMER